MKQAIAGVTLPSQGEVTIMSVWPSISVFGLGRTLGELFSIRAGISVLTVGNLIALASIPVALGLYALRTFMRYRLTNCRVIEHRGLGSDEVGSVDLDRFDSIEISVRPGQAWYESGDLIFRQGQIETFRLEGVSRPAAFRSTCMKARMGFVGVKNALEQQHVTA